MVYGYMLCEVLIKHYINVCFSYKSQYWIPKKFLGGQLQPVQEDERE